jgi:cytochrome c2
LLDKWLTDPDSLIADNDMAFRVSKPDERADIIRYLKTLSVSRTMTGFCYFAKDST